VLRKAAFTYLKEAEGPQALKLYQTGLSEALDAPLIHPEIHDLQTPLQGIVRRIKTPVVGKKNPQTIVIYSQMLLR